jgi:hypothetical protein
MSDMPTTVEIFDIAGWRVAEMPDDGTVGVVRERPEKEGRFANRPYNREYIWQPEKSLPSGVYLVRARLGGEAITKRVVYLK